VTAVAGLCSLREANRSGMYCAASANSGSEGNNVLRHDEAVLFSLHINSACTYESVSIFIG
jgi:hypothetical protein